ncbi:YwaF family protein [Tepidibacter formicigenes]|jgi:hypothetical integral membrane protein (TIGR02206 family)|uniref:Conserved hypothetical integral membrane protein TIGR02206 n=1 Tax=Tepidibacter formicigenes DSM 15518 TaxID=1123349 RepID=A0A1M6RY19_9FIRM|nr:TIGR02206 family membrane protein [Tepidibacter formicigenes]SHK37310.1 conserved hypothetical integral membrane protein TIGR02206 [Tepidibacter formicigenes DSM 15518]
MKYIDINSFWKVTSDTAKFNLYSKSHLTSLFIIIGIIVLMFLMRERIQNNKRKIRIIVALILFIQQFFLYYWYLDSGTFTLKESLPLYLCRISSILCIIMLIKESYSIFEVVYFWGILGAVQALLTPDTGGFEFPHIMFIQFFVGHGAILIAIFFMMIFYKYEPKLTSIKKTVKWTFIYAFYVGIFNYIVDGNYSYLRSKPLTASPLDYLPEYPYYIPIIICMFISSFILVYIPFYIKDRKCKIKSKAKSY